MPTEDKKTPAKKTASRFIPLSISKPVMIFLAILVVVFFLIGTQFNGIILAAKVNKKPVYTWEFAKHLVSRYSQKAMDDLVRQKLIEEEAEKNQISVSEEEITSEIEAIRQEIGGQEALDKILKQEGISATDFKQEAKFQVLIKKILEKRTTITDREIEAFITQYEAQMEATDEAGLKKEALAILESQKMSEGYALLFSELKEKALISQFLNF